MISSIESDKNSGNNHHHQWQVLQWRAHTSTQSTPTRTSTHTTPTHTHTGAQVFLVLAYTFARSQTVSLPTAHGTAWHGQARKRIHSCSLKAGLKRAHKRTCTHKNLTQRHYYPLASDAKMSTGRERLCVSRERACRRVICLKLTPPTLSQWQQVSSQAQTFVNSECYRVHWEQNYSSRSPCTHKVIVKLLWWKVFFPCHK